jgi:hypothetical protein
MLHAGDIGRSAARHFVAKACGDEGWICRARASLVLSVIGEYRHARDVHASLASPERRPASTGLRN